MQGPRAGSFKYRGILDYRPSMARRVAHIISHEVFIDAVSRDERIAILTASRTKPLAEGNSVRFRITDSGIEVSQDDKK